MPMKTAQRELRVNDWLEVMLGEIDRKKQESEEAKRESERRKGDDTRNTVAGDEPQPPVPAQSK